MGYFATIIVPPWLHPLVQFAPVPVGGIVAVLLNLWIIRSYFKGKMRGAFEYVYRESLLEFSINSELSSARPGPGEMLLELESLALYKALMTQANSQLEDARFICYMAAAKAANAGGEDRNSITALKQAVALKPKNVVANFRLARSYERIGSAKEAIDAYEAAFLDPSVDSEELKEFIAAQVQRVREMGPEQRSPIPGLIYQLM